MTQTVSRDDDPRLLLEARAAELARPVTEESDSGSLEMLVVSVSGRQVGIPVEHLREVRTPGHVTRVPGSNGVLIGLVGGYGGALAAASLARMLGLPSAVRPDEQWVAVLDDRSSPLGLFVDTADGLLTVAAADLSRQPESGGLVMARAPGGTLVLDPAAVLSDSSAFCTPPRPRKGVPWDDA